MIDGTAYSVMVGIGEQILPAFVLALALGEVASGLVATLPPMVGAILQLGSHAGVRLVGSHKRWVLIAVGIQAVSFVPLVIGAIVGAMPTWAVFAAATAYWLGGASAGAAWSTWVGTLTPPRIRARWFGLRQMALQGGTLAGFIAAGVVLALVSQGQDLKAVMQTDALRGVLLAFAALFAVAGVCRAVSFYGLTRQTEPEPMPAGHRGVGVLELLRRARSRPDSASGQDVWLIGYMVAVSFAAQICSPFVNPYLLEQRQTGFLTWTLLVGLVMFGKAVALNALGRYAHKHGARRLLWFGGVGTTLIGFLWAGAPGQAGADQSAWFFGYLVGVQLFSGVTWACYELATWLLLLEHLDERERTSLMSVYFCANYLATAAGSLLGGWLLTVFGKDLAAYHWVFVLSSVARLFTIALLWHVARRVSLPVQPNVNPAGAEPIRANE